MTAAEAGAVATEVSAAYVVALIAMAFSSADFPTDAIPCSGGGSNNTTGDFVDADNATVTVAPASCQTTNGITFTGDPDIDFTVTGDTETISGGITWSSTDGRSGSCSISTDSVCGHSVD